MFFQIRRSPLHMNNFFEADLKAPALREPVKKANDNVRYVLMAEFEFKIASVWVVPATGRIKTG